MPLKVNIGLSKKVGDPNYGSHGAMVNLEAEVDASLIGNPAGFRERIHSMFNMVRTSLADELNGHANGNGLPPVQQNGNGHHASNGEPPVNGAAAPRTNGSANGNGARPATPSQVKAIYYIAKRFNVDVWQLLREHYHRSRAEDLTLPEASRLIDVLKAGPAPAN